MSVDRECRVHGKDGQPGCLLCGALAEINALQKERRDSLEPLLAVLRAGEAMDREKKFLTGAHVPFPGFLIPKATYEDLERMVRAASRTLRRCAAKEKVPT